MIFVLHQRFFCFTIFTCVFPKLALFPNRKHLELMKVAFLFLGKGNFESHLYMIAQWQASGDHLNHSNCSNEVYFWAKRQWWLSKIDTVHNLSTVLMIMSIPGFHVLFVSMFVSVNVFVLTSLSVSTSMFMSKRVVLAGSRVRHFAVSHRCEI